VCIVMVKAQSDDMSSRTNPVHQLPFQRKGSAIAVLVKQENRIERGGQMISLYQFTNQISRASSFIATCHSTSMSPAYAPLRTVALVRRLRLFHWGLAQTISIASLA